jgi:hypothetical protein
MARIITNPLLRISNPRLQKIAWFAVIYVASIVGFGVIVGILQLALPK